MTLRFQRLLIILISLILISGAVILILFNSKNNITFFYTPSELVKKNISINQKIRVGGFVKKNSVKYNPKNMHFINFIITDNINDVNVEFEGILPDLFREEQGAVVEGFLINNNLKVDRVFAKHDENYMPASIKKQLEKTNYWKKNY